MKYQLYDNLNDKVLSTHQRIDSVGRAAAKVVKRLRRQFKCKRMSIDWSARIDGRQLNFEDAYFAYKEYLYQMRNKS